MRPFETMKSTIGLQAKTLVNANGIPFFLSIS
jgi:hypothetical protein